MRREGVMSKTEEKYLVTAPAFPIVPKEMELAFQKIVLDYLEKKVGFKITIEKENVGSNCLKRYLEMEFSKKGVQRTRYDEVVQLLKIIEDREVPIEIYLLKLKSFIQIDIQVSSAEKTCRFMGSLWEYLAPENVQRKVSALANAVSSCTGASLQFGSELRNCLNQCIVYYKQAQHFDKKKLFRKKPNQPAAMLFSQADAEAQHSEQNQGNRLFLAAARVEASIRFFNLFSARPPQKNAEIIENVDQILMRFQINVLAEKFIAFYKKQEFTLDDISNRIKYFYTHLLASNALVCQANIKKEAERLYRKFWKDFTHFKTLLKQEIQVKKGLI